jgi:two-component system, chemotaxis family, protein-glutamate methylesterase/glutaminase
VEREIVVIGASWGGLAALRCVLGTLRPSFPLAVVVVPHRHRDSDHSLLSELLQDRSAIPVEEANDQTPLAGGRAYVAPPDYHLLIDRGHLSLSTDPPVKFSRPSIDVTFASAAATYGARAVGVVLTGANNDGAEGLRRIAERGGYAIVQDPATAESKTMPAAALRAVPTARVLPITEIGPHLVDIAAGTPGTERSVIHRGTP